MGDRALEITIHAEPRIDWQRKRANCLAIGLRKLGFEPKLTRSRHRESHAPAVLLGTTCWKQIEALPGDWLLVDRASIGDPEYVSLVWNGHGRRGNHRVPKGYDGSRFAALDVEIEPMVEGGKQVVLCGQTELYTDRFASLDEWYETKRMATHFRPHPAGDNPTRLPVADSWDNCSYAITLNSSVAVDALLHGVPVIVDDEGGMAFDWPRFKTRQPFFEWLAWTQWSWDEIREGQVEHLFSWLKSKD